MTFARPLLVGFLVGAILTLLVLARTPGVSLPRVEPITTTGDNGVIVESFVVDLPADAIALTHSGALPLDVMPASAPKFADRELDRGLALLAKVRNERGEVIGFVSELALIAKAAGDRLGVGDWTLVLPGRGTLFFHQEAPGRALVVGGTGAFAEPKGALVVVSDGTKAQEGVLTGRMELRLVHEPAVREPAR